MAGHAQLKFVMTECSKTQIRLTRPIYDLTSGTHQVSNGVVRCWDWVTVKIQTDGQADMGKPYKPSSDCSWEQGLHRLLFCVRLLDTFLYGKATLCIQQFYGLPRNWDLRHLTSLMIMGALIFCLVLQCLIFTQANIWQTNKQINGLTYGRTTTHMHLLT